MVRDLTKERRLAVVEEIRRCSSVYDNCDCLLEHSDCDDVIDYIEDLQKYNEVLEANNKLLLSQKYQLEKELDEILDKKHGVIKYIVEHSNNFAEYLDVFEVKALYEILK